MATEEKPEGNHEEKTIKASSILPPDIVAAAEKVEMDVEDLGKLCVNHSVEAAREFLSWLVGKLPDYQKPKDAPNP